MPTSMKTKDSLRRKKGMRRRKRGGGGGEMWTTVTEEGRTGPLLPLHDECTSHTHKAPSPRHLASCCTKAGRAPVLPMTCFGRGAFGHMEAFSRSQSSSFSKGTSKTFRWILTEMCLCFVRLHSSDCFKRLKFSKKKV